MSETPTNLPTPGPWRWEFNLKSQRLQLCGGDPKRHGRYDLAVMDFIRWGFSKAVPRVRQPIREHLNIMEPAHKYTAIAPGREHHADWFRLADHPDMRLIEAAPTLLTACRSLLDALRDAGLEHLIAYREAMAIADKAEGFQSDSSTTGS